MLGLIHILTFPFICMMKVKKKQKKTGPDRTKAIRWFWFTLSPQISVIFIFVLLVLYSPASVNMY